MENSANLWKTWILCAILWLVLLCRPVFASVHTYSEPNGVMYRSLSTLQDHSHRAWQAVFYKRFQLGQPDTLHLRLIGFPSVVTLQHPESLEIEADHTLLQATDVTSPEFPVAHVGEYDFKPILTRLDSDARLKLVLPTQEKATIEVPSETLLEWWRVASWQATLRN